MADIKPVFGFDLGRSVYLVLRSALLCRCKFYGHVLVRQLERIAVARYDNALFSVVRTFAAEYSYNIVRFKPLALYSYDSERVQHLFYYGKLFSQFFGHGFASRLVILEHFVPVSRRFQIESRSDTTLFLFF